MGEAATVVGAQGEEGGGEGGGDSTLRLDKVRITLRVQDLVTMIFPFDN